MVSYALIVESRELTPSVDGSLTLTRSRASGLRGDLALFARDVDHVTAVAKLESVEAAPEIGPRTFAWRFSNLRLLAAPMPLTGRTSGPVWLRLAAAEREQLPLETGLGHPSAPEARPPRAQSTAHEGLNGAPSTAGAASSPPERRAPARGIPRAGPQRSPARKGDTLTPVAAQAAPDLWREYMREDIPTAFGDVFNTGVWNQGFAIRDKDVFLLVTLDKTGAADTAKYSDYFIDRDTFHWQSQNRTSRQSSTGRIIRGQAPGYQIHLFVRAQKRRGSLAAPFVYCGKLSFKSWRDDNPISVVWRLATPLPEHLLGEFLTMGKQD